MKQTLHVVETGEVVAGETMRQQREEDEPTDDQERGLHTGRAVAELGTARRRRRGQGAPSLVGDAAAIGEHYACGPCDTRARSDPRS
jgi:hypothetical protein